MKFGFSQQEIERTALSLGLPTNQPFINRRIAHAFDLVQSSKVTEIEDGIYRVRSQYEPDKSYIVSVNHGNPSCTCPDHQKNPGTVCKHIVSSMIVEQEKQPRFRIIDDTKHSCEGRGRWVIFDNEERMGYVIYRNKHGELECACLKKDCIHEKLVKSYLEKHGKRIVNECGSKEAKALQDKLNGNNGNGNNANGNGESSSPFLNIHSSAKPFMESDEMDAQQILTSQGDKVHKLSNGSYCISYLGLIELADKHGIITETLENHPYEGYVTVKAFRPDTRNSRKSVQAITGNSQIANGKAKRNAVRMLLPIVEIRAMEYKAKLEDEFSWEKAKAKCLEIVPEFKVGIAINDLVRIDKLRQAHPSSYHRTEWLMIYRECRNDAETNGNEDNNGGGDNPSPSDNSWRDKLSECQEAAKNFRRYDILKEDLQRECVIPKEHPREWHDKDFATLKDACQVDESLFGRKVGHWTIELEPNEKIWAWFGRYDFWLTPLHERCFWCEETKDNLQDCCVEWGRYSFKTLLCLDCKPSVEELTERFDQLYRGDVDPSEQKVELPDTMEEFVAKCQKAESEIANENLVEANSMPLENGNGKRVLGDKIIR